MYRRNSLLEVGGIDSRFHTYDACDLHTRLLRQCPGQFRLEPKAIVLHHHRPDWGAYWRQQRGYGKGLGQFYWKYRNEIQWSAGRELGAWFALVSMGLSSIYKGKSDKGLIRRGRFLKTLAQRMGFVETYWRRKERKKW